MPFLPQLGSESVRRYLLVGGVAAGGLGLLLLLLLFGRDTDRSPREFTPMTVGEEAPHPQPDFDAALYQTPQAPRERDVPKIEVAWEMDKSTARTLITELKLAAATGNERRIRSMNRALKRYRKVATGLLQEAIAVTENPEIQDVLRDSLAQATR